MKSASLMLLSAPHGGLYGARGPRDRLAPESETVQGHCMCVCVCVCTCVCVCGGYHKSAGVHKSANRPTSTLRFLIINPKPQSGGGSDLQKWQIGAPRGMISSVSLCIHTHTSFCIHTHTRLSVYIHTHTFW
jgi:hypothetical protein